MAGAVQISHAMGLIGEEVIAKQRRLLERFELPIRASGVNTDAVFTAMSLDKKTQEGSIKWVLLEDVGKAAVHNNVPSALVQETLNSLLQ